MKYNIDYTLGAPHSIEAEKALLGTIISEPYHLDSAIDSGLTPDDFFSQTHQELFRALSDMRNSGISIDVVTLSQYLEDNKILDGGITLIGDIASSYVSPISSEHIKTIFNKSMLRKMQKALYNGLYEISEREHEPEAVIADIEKVVLEVSDGGESHKTKIQQDVVCSTLEQIEKTVKYRKELDANGRHSEPIGIPTGIRELDRLTTGLRGGQMWVIAARTGVGKTAFALQMTRAAASLNYPVGFITMEMSAENLLMRIISREASIDSMKIRSGTISDHELNQLKIHGDRLKKLPIFYEDVPTLSASRLGGKIRRLIARHGVKLIVIDYLQLMSGEGKGEQRYQELGKISRTVKSLSMEYNIPIVALAQLNRDAAEGEPKLHHLRESGNIEHDADTILLLGAKESVDNPFEQPMILNIAKQRDGAVAEIDIVFNKKIGLFEEQRTEAK